MTSNRERQIFEACLKLDREDRASFIDDACSDDAQLAERVRRLLAAHDRAELHPTEAVAAAGAAPLEDPKEIGPYRILERVGEGGMGVVYVAEQTRPIKRLVALKIVKLGMDTKDVIARFDSERQALALMNHPNIARIIDAGATESGRPYFVMEYVRGMSIVDYCDQRQLDIDARLRLFIYICLAVEHAHQKGVIHRDLKRTNILVTEEHGRPYPKVIDFGIAKATNQRLTELTLYTKVGHVVGTPEYMSPEQAGAGGDVDTSTDVYSLGVVLYELLVGVRPFDFGASDQGYHEILRVIREDDPPPPSVRLAQLPEGAADRAAARSTTTAHLVRKTRGELDWITMTALAKQPRRRYASAAAFAADLQKYLDNKPVTAAPPGVWSRMRTVARRYRTAVVTAATLGLAAVAVATGLSLRPAPTLPIDGTPRILVLPFQFLGPTDDAYLAEGISEEIRHRLSGLTNLTLLGRQTAVFASTNAMSMEQMASELDADFILDGTVRMQRVADGPDRMRIRAALTNTNSLSQLWTDTYDGSMDDVFGAQSDVASRVVEAVGIKLPAAEERLLLAHPTDDLQAYDYFLRGKNYERRSELESDMRTALELYYESAELDPDFAAAWAAVSVMRSRIRWRGYDDSGLNLGLAKEAGERALAVDPDDAQGHFALGYYNYYGFRDYDAALDNFLAADKRRPNDSEILYALGLVYRRRGDWDAALTALGKALSLNPRNVQVAITLGETALAVGEYEEAERHFDRALDIAPNRPGIYLFRAWLYLASKPDADAALDALRQGTETVGSTRLFALLGRYVSATDWWISRTLASEEPYQRIFDNLDPIAASMDSVAYYLHSAEFHRTLGRAEMGRVYYDSVRTVLQPRVGSLPDDGSVSDLTPNERSRRANDMMWLAVAYAGLGLADSAVSLATEGAALFNPELDALHGSEGLLHLGLIHGMVGNREAAVEQLERVWLQPSAFRPGMLRHDAALAPLLEDPRLRRLLQTP
jgi:serine/threonine protein kinase